jgi:hypothetical protein
VGRELGFADEPEAFALESAARAGGARRSRAL